MTFYDTGDSIGADYLTEDSSQRIIEEHRAPSIKSKRARTEGGSSLDIALPWFLSVVHQPTGAKKISKFPQ